MRHSKSRFIEDARRVGTGAVRKPHLPGGESVYLFLEFTKILALEALSFRAVRKLRLLF